VFENSELSHCESPLDCHPEQAFAARFFRSPYSRQAREKSTVEVKDFLRRFYILMTTACVSSIMFRGGRETYDSHLSFLIPEAAK
jgi:hypothetical protein